MTLNTPVLYQVAPFDANSDFALPFSYAGNQSVKNTLLIKNSETLEIVYEQTVPTFRLSHTIPADTLVNGMTYQAQVKVYDANNSESNYSLPIVFKCLSAPIFEFVNLTENQTIKAANYDVQLLYMQHENEALDSFKIGLYDISKNLIFQTDVFYDVANLHYIIEGMSNDTSYYIRVVGKTVSGLNVDTGFISFIVEFITPELFSVVQTTNNELQGTTTIASNIILIEGTYDEIPVYLDGTKIDLRNNTLVYNEGFTIGKDFSLQIIVEDYSMTQPILNLDNGNIKLWVVPGKQYSTHEGKKYIHLESSCNTWTYVLDSNYFATDKVQINLRRSNGLYSLEALEVFE